MGLIRILFVVLGFVAATRMLVPVGGVSALQAEQQDRDLVWTAMEDGRFDTLVEAIARAGLMDQLRSQGPYTLFAPTDYAFSSIPEEDLAYLMANPQLLKQLLLHHVVAGHRLQAELATTGTVTSETGTTLVLMKHGEELMVDGAIVERNRIDAANGILYVVNRVLIPQDIERQLEKLAGLDTGNDEVDGANRVGPVTQLPTSTAPSTRFLSGTAGIVSSQQVSVGISADDVVRIQPEYTIIATAAPGDPGAGSGKNQRGTARQLVGIGIIVVLAGSALAIWRRQRQ